MKKLLVILLSIGFCFMLIGCSDEAEEIKKEIKAPALTEKLKVGAELDYADYTEVTKENEKYLNVDIVFKNEMLYEGTVKAIINLIDKEFSEKYNSIKLIITQKEPLSFVEYNYNGKWDRIN